MSDIEVSTKQERIAENARRLPEVSFTTLAHYMDERWMYEACRQTRKDAAVGIDGVTFEEYCKNLEENLKSLHDRAKSGRYRAPAVRRVHIPKSKGGETRPLGIPTLEDKILQRAVKMVLEPLYEQSFLNCSYGFRPERSQHKAIELMRKKLIEIGGGWIIDVDIRKYFDSIDHAKLREILSKRVCDGVLTRLVGKWLKAGIFEEGVMRYNTTGTQQGGVLSPLLSNVYLHEAIDVWFEDTAKPRLKGRAFMVRFADDIVMGFEYKEDALRILEVLPKRLNRYNLSLHPEKTRLLYFGKPSYKKEYTGKPESFDFLGFTHYWGKSRKGHYVIKHKTAKDRLARFNSNMNEWLKKYRHADINMQYLRLCQKLKGHYGYYGITGNFRCLKIAWESSKKLWKKWLGRRSRNNRMNWNKFNLLLDRFPLPKPRVVHSIYTAKL